MGVMLEFLLQSSSEPRSAGENLESSPLLWSAGGGGHDLLQVSGKIE